jgi:transcriptional regulator with XRE-family HTH domain
MEWRKESRRQTVEDLEPHLHSLELRVLIALLKRERIRQGLSLRDVARVTDQARSAISRLENGQYPNPTLDTVYRYALALGMHITLTAEPRLTESIADSDTTRDSGSRS